MKCVNKRKTEGIMVMRGGEMRNWRKKYDKKVAYKKIE